MTSDAGVSVSSLPVGVEARLRSYLPYGGKVVACLRTAEAFMIEAYRDTTGLRYGESVAYNLREALDAAVKHQEVTVVQLSDVVEAWLRYEDRTAQDHVEALADLERTLRQARDDWDRGQERDHRFVAHYQRRTRLQPLTGDLDPLDQYSRLVRRSNKGLHEYISVPDAFALYEDALAWFVRVFTPPEDRLVALGQLADQPYTDVDQIAELQRLATDDHHLRFFFTRVSDPAWLEPLYSANLIALPQPGVRWAPAHLDRGLGRSAPEAVADLLAWLIRDHRRLPSKDRLPVAFEMLRVASRLGPPGHTVAEKLTTWYRTDRNIRAIARSVALSADTPAESNMVLAAARATLVDRHPSSGVLDKHEAGITESNVVGRIKMLAGCLREFLGDDPYDFEDAAALPTPLDEYAQPRTIAAHYLARALPVVKRFRPTSDLLQWLDSIPGRLGKRIRCQAMAGAEDVAVEDKISHVTRQLSCSTVTGDDQALVNDILALNPASSQLAEWRDAFGAPSPLPEGLDGATDLPADWVRAWQWSMVLPQRTLDAWREQIAAVSEIHGTPTPEVLTSHQQRFWFRSSQTPIEVEVLSALPPVEAARLIVSWRPNRESEWNLESARTLARAMEEAVKQNLTTWTEDPEKIVTTLREPIYVQHYLETLSTRAEELGDKTPAVLRAAGSALWIRPTPVILGRDDFEYEPTWDNVERAVVDLTAAIADRDGDFADQLNPAWVWVMALAETAAGETDAEPDEPDDDRDHLHHAINNRRGRGTIAAIALAGWEHRNRGHVRPEFTAHLNTVLARSGDAGMEARAILAMRRRRLEVYALDWLEENADTLFREGAKGRATLDMTLKWSRPSPWLYAHLQPGLLDAVSRGSHNAVEYLVVAVLNEVTGYDIDLVLRRFTHDVNALKAIAEASARTVQNTSENEPVLIRAVEFWRALLNWAQQERQAVGALAGLGAWAFAEGISDATWADLTRQTLDATAGRIIYLDGIASRLRRLPAAQAIPILMVLLGTGEEWEANYVEEVALGKLAQAVDEGSHPEQVNALRSRLLELGRDEAA